MGMEEVRECPECGSRYLITDYVKAELYCADCGLVIVQNIVDLGLEQRGGKSLRNRIPPINYPIHHEGLATTDALESNARSLIANWDFQKAKLILKQIMEFAPEFKQSLQNEFGFLYNFAISIEEDEKLWNENKELIKRVFRKSIYDLKA